MKPRNQITLGEGYSMGVTDYSTPLEIALEVLLQDKIDSLSDARELKYSLKEILWDIKFRIYETTQ